MHFLSRSSDQVFAADEMHLISGEVLEPPVKVFAVKSYLDGTPRSVDQSRRVVVEGELLEALGGHLGPLADGLGIVRNGPRHRVTNHDQ